LSTTTSATRRAAATSRCNELAELLSSRQFVSMVAWTRNGVHGLGGYYPFHRRQPAQTLAPCTGAFIS
jgi:hypothetical protein